MRGWRLSLIVIIGLACESVSWWVLKMGGVSYLWGEGEGGWRGHCLYRCSNLIHHQRVSKYHESMLASAHNYWRA